MKVFSPVACYRVAPCRVLTRPHFARPPGRSLLSRINAGVDVENATQVTLTESQLAELHSRFPQKDGKVDIEAIRVLEQESSLPVKEWFPGDVLERIFEQGFVTFDQFEHLCEANLILEGKLKEYRIAFDAVDRSGNGTIGYNELVDLFGSLGSPMSEAKITELMVEYDLDKSGQIEFGEFLLLFQNQLLDLKEVLQYTKNVEQIPEGSKGLILLKPGEVMKIFTEAEFDEILERNPEKLIVLFAGLTWCRPCKAVIRPYEKLAAYYNEAIFLKFFGNANSSTKRLFVERLEAKATPAFFFFREKKLIHSHTGKDKAKLEGHLRTFI